MHLSSPKKCVKTFEAKNMTCLCSKCCNFKEVGVKRTQWIPNIFVAALLKAKQIPSEWTASRAMISWLLCDLSHGYSLLPVVWKVAVRDIMWLSEDYNVITVKDADLAKLDRFVRIFFISLSTIYKQYLVTNAPKPLTLFPFHSFWRELCFCGCFELCHTQRDGIGHLWTGTGMVLSELKE